MPLYAAENRIKDEPNGKALYALDTEKPVGTAAVQELMAGVSLVFHTVNARELGAANKKPLPHTLEINHCRAGRFCCTFADGTERRLVAGEISVDLLEHETVHATFPDGRYSGVSLVVDIPAAQRSINEMLAAVTGSPLDLTALEVAVRRSGGFLLPNIERNEALFSALYLSTEHAEDVALQRLRMLEILAHICHAVDAIRLNKQDFSHDRQMLAVRDTLTEHCARHITLGQLSAQFGISQTALKTRFQRAFGTTIDRYLRVYRLKTAEHLLLTTNRKISDIAQAVGFRSTSIFSVRFAEQFGTSPGQYRQNSQKTAKNDQSSINPTDRELSKDA